MSSLESFAAETKAASQVPKTVSPFVKAARLLLFVSTIALAQPVLRKRGAANLSDYASLRSLFVKNPSSHPTPNNGGTVGASSMVVGRDKAIFSESSGASGSCIQSEEVVTGVASKSAADSINIMDTKSKSVAISNTMESLIIDTWVEDMRRKKII